METGFDEFTLDVKVDHHKVSVASTLKIFASSAREPNSDEHLIQYESHERHTERKTIKCEYYTVPYESPSIMHAWLYEHELVPDTRVTTARLVARGYASYQAIKRGDVPIIELRTMTDDTYGRVNITPINKCIHTASDRDDDTCIAKLEARRKDDFDQFATSIKARYMELKRSLGVDIIPQNSAFFYVESNFGKVPVTTFAYLSRFITNSKAEVVDLLRSLERHINPRHTSIEERLVDFCTLITRPMIYVEDHAKSKNDRDTAIDQWMQLGTFPILSETGFDCEDGSALILSIIFLLKHSDVSEYPELVTLQSFAKQYTPFLTLGNLKSNGATPYVSHAYVVMMDSRWVQYQLEGNFSIESPTGLNHALTLESTASLSGVWDDTSTQKIDASNVDPMVTEYINIRESLISVFAESHALFALCRQYAPMRASNRNHYDHYGSWLSPDDTSNKYAHCGSYGHTFVLMTTDHNGKAVHAIVTQGNCRIGAYADQLMMYKSDVKLHVLSQEAESDFESKYGYVLQQQPKNILPVVNKVTPAGSKDDTKSIVGYVDVPGRVWDAHNDTITECTSRMTHHATRVERLEIADATVIYRIYIYMKRV